MKDQPGSATPAIALEGLSLRLGSFTLRGIDLALGPGEIGVILGPNGAGKSVTLEVIAGFHRPDKGRVTIKGRDVTDLPPERRHVGFILQNFGLFPHLTVAENIAFGLHARRSKRPAAIAPLLARFRLEALADARPATLSPGEKQRVALARSLMTEPDVFLFDEPFAALDARTSERLREELRDFIREAGIPAIFVTHDHLDALMLADQVAVMANGEIVQSGEPTEVFRRPESRFVAEFLGVENILTGTVAALHGGGCTVAVAGRDIEVAMTEPPPAGQSVLLCIPADAIDVARSGHGLAVGGGHPICLSGAIAAMTNVGPLVRMTLDCGFFLTAHLLQRTVRERELAVHQQVMADIDPAAIHLIRAA